jgi:glycosyltransferase involved in cell wall biosynthesis
MKCEDSICVIITTFNSEKFISSAIESVISQNVVPAEIVVVDNGSSDSTRSEVEEFGVPFFTQTKGRVGESRNYGLKKTVSPFVKFLDADDLLKPKALETLQNTLRLGQSQFVYGQNLNFVDSTYPPIGNGEFTHTSVPIFSPTPLNAMLHRDVFEFFGLPQGDNFSWIRWFTEVKSRGLQVTKVHEIVGMRRIHSKNISHTTNSKLELFKLIRNQIANGKINNEN